jgi:ligand-binding sensor domain-containing protein
MPKHLRRACVSLVLLVGLGLSTFFARAHAAGGPDELWQTFQEGLPSTNVLAVLPASDGAIWFGTDRGASRYDGEWQSLSSQNGLPAGQVRSMAQTADRAVWFGVEAGGLARRAPNGDCCRVWTTTEGLPSDDIRVLLTARDGKLWLGTARGLVYLDGDRPVIETQVPAAPVVALAAGADGALWVSLEGQGLWGRDAAGVWQRIDEQGLPGGPARALLAEQDGTLWAGTDNGLGYRKGRVWRQFPLLGDDSGITVYSLLRDDQGGLWVGTDKGIFYSPDGLPGSALRHFRSQDGLASDHVRGLKFDRDGALWAGTVAGVSRYAGNIWQRVPDPVLAARRINALLTDRAGRLWVGTEGGGLSMWDGSAWRHFGAADGLNDRRILVLFEDDRGRMWVGTGAGAGYYDGKAWHIVGPAAGLPAKPVWSIGQDRAGNLWIGTDSGLGRWSDAAGFQPIEETGKGRVTAIHLAQDGSLWAGTDQDGLHRLRGDVWQRVPAADARPRFKSIVPNGIAERPDGVLFVATADDGLWRYQPGQDGQGQWQPVELAAGSAGLLTLAYAEGSLWVGTRGGLARSDDRSSQWYAGSVLPNPEVSAIAAGRDGSFWFGTLEGLVHYRPEKTLPWVRIASVNLSEAPDGSVTLTGNQALTVRLAGGRAGVRPENLKYLTQLDGEDGQPRVFSNGLISYADLRLRPGTYRLRAWARDEAFNYSEPVEVAIKVVAPERLVVLPGGRRMPAVLFYPGIALSAVALGVLLTAGGVTWRSYRKEKQRASAAAARRQEALGRRFNPYISGEPVRDPDMFFGRHDLLRRILNALHQNSIMISGERRIGKTTLLYRLGEELRASDDPEWVFIPVMVDMEGTPQQQFFHLLMENICGVLRGYLREALPLRFNSAPAGNYTDRDFIADLRALIEALKPVVAPRTARVVLLIDEMDVINTYDALVQQQLRRIFMSSQAYNLGAVVAGIQISKAWDRVESPWYNMFNEIQVDPFPQDEARRLLVEPVRGVYEWEGPALEFVLAHADGRPYRLQQFGLQAVNHMLAEGRERINLADVEAADRLIERAHAT